MEMGGLSLEQTKSLKAITALYVVLGHIGKVVDQPTWFKNVASFAWIDVGVFFFISGYGLAYGYHNKKNYFSGFHKRFFNVLIPFLAAHIVYMIGNKLFGIKYGLADIMKSLLGQSTLVRNDWYVPVCLLYYCMFWLIYRRKIGECLKQIILAIFICIYIFVFSYVLNLGEYWWMNALPFFGGVWWQTICQREREQSNRKSVWLRRVLVCVVGYAAAYVGVPISNRIFGTYAYKICYNLMSLFGVGLIVLIFSTIGEGNLLTSFIATVSYEIYLYHGLFIDGFRSNAIYIENDTMYVIAVYTATIVLSIIMHYSVAWLRELVGKRIN